MNAVVPFPAAAPAPDDPQESPLPKGEGLIMLARRMGELYAIEYIKGHPELLEDNDDDASR